MMNRSKIEWTDFSWNPITGCLHICPYCYARKQSKRFCGDIRLNKTSPQLQQEGDLYILDKPFYNISGKVVPLPVGFEPTLHRYRLNMPQEKKLPANIFVGSMADIFGDWVPDEWLRKVFEACEAAPWHRYIFLTKNPSRYKAMCRSHENWWFGCSITDNSGFAPTGPAFDLYQAKDKHGINTFLSIEPLHEAITRTSLANFDCFDWVIIGAESGNRKDKVIPKREWIEEIAEQCRVAGVPIFMKRGEKQKDGTYFLEKLMGDEFVQEFPKGLEACRPPLPKHRVFVEHVRDKKTCKHCDTDLQGKSATRMGGRYYLCENCLEGDDKTDGINETHE